MMKETKGPVTATIVGAGHRSLAYAEYALSHPDELKIVGVAEPDEFRREKTASMFNIPDKNCFENAMELAQQPLISDVVINGTMDKDHVPTAIPLLRAGYHMLLEKPIGTEKQEVIQLSKVAKETGRIVMICHVLRYAPFYVEIRKRVASGEIGEIMHINTEECVSYHHMSASFVRGKWNSRKLCNSPFLMSKCCHDLDLIAWFKSGIKPLMVGSFGSTMYFRPEKKPQEAGTRCLVDCPIEESCLYSARKLYIDHPDRWDFYVWSFIENIKNPTIEQKIESLKTNNPHGRCIWSGDNDIVDHQSVMIQFEDGSTANHSLVGGTSKGLRSIHLLGTKGEILGVVNDGYFVIRHPDPRPGKEYTEERIDINISNDMHGGGDLRLVEDFVKVIRGRAPSISTTNLEDSINGHLIGFEADESMLKQKMVEIAF